MIRIAEITDKQVITDFYKSNNAGKYYLHFDLSNTFFAYIVDNKIVSMLSIKGNRIHALLTPCEHRGKGYMTELLGFVINLMVSGGIKTIKTCAMESSKNIFMKYGFKLDRINQAKNFVSYHLTYKA